jgi:general secretion pathway protein G
MTSSQNRHKSRRSNRLKNKKLGFTLIEVIMVIILLGIVATMSIDSLTGSLTEDKVEATLQEMRAIRNAMVGDPTILTGGVRSNFGYLGDLGGIPTAVQGLSALVTNPGLPAWAMNASVRIGYGWNGPYINNVDSGNDITTDAWGTAYVYSPAASPPTLVSRGSDGAVGGTGTAADITIQIPNNDYKATVNGVILTGGVQWSGDAQIEMNYPDGNGGLTQTLTTITAAANGAFSFTNIPLGMRSATAYVPSKAAPTTTIGTFIFAIDKNFYVMSPNFNFSYTIEVPIEMIDGGISSSNAGTVTFDRSETNLDTTAYDGTITYRFEAVCDNSDAVNRTLDLMDVAAGTSAASLTLLPSAGTYTRYVTTWVPTAGSRSYKLRTPTTTAANRVTCYTARILVHQQSTSGQQVTKTKIYIPMVADDAATGADSDNTVTGNNVDTSTTRNAYLQGNANHYSIFRKDTSRFATIAAGTPWTLDVILAYSGAGAGSKASLFNKTTGNQVTASECSGGGTTMARCAQTFSDTATDFTDNNDFEVQIKRQGGPAGTNVWLWKAGLWLNLTSVTKADVYYRIGKYLQTAATATDTRARAMIDHTRYTSPTFYHESIGLESVVGTSDLRYVTEGTSDSTSAGTDVAGTSFNPGTTTKTRTRSAAISTMVSGDRFLPKTYVTTGTFNTISDFIIVEVQ